MIIPILATIILMGTIATLILAVGAYFLYKKRSRSSGNSNELIKLIEEVKKAKK